VTTKASLELPGTTRILFFTYQKRSVLMVRFISAVVLDDQLDGGAALTVEGWTSFRDRIEALAPFSAADMRVTSFSVSGLSTLNGGISLESPDMTTRPLLSSIPTAGEIGARAGEGDAGFLRLSAGGSTDPTMQSFIDVSAGHTDPDLHGVISLGTLGAERLRLTGSAATFTGPVLMQGLTSTSGMFTQGLTAANGLRVTSGTIDLLATTMNGTLTGTSANFSSSAVNANILTIQNTSAAATSSSQVSLLGDNPAGGMNLWLNSTTRTTGGPANGATMQNDVGQLRLGVNYGGVANHLTINNTLATFDNAVTIAGALTANAGLAVSGAGGLTVSGGSTTLGVTSTAELTATALTVNGPGTMTSTATSLTLTSTAGGVNSPFITLNNTTGGPGNTVGLNMSPFSTRAGGSSARILAVDDTSSGAYLSLWVAGGSAAATASEQLRVTTSQTSIFGDLSVAKTVLWGTSPVPAAPTTTFRSTGTRIVLYPQITSTTTDYAIGVDGNTRWDSVPANTSTFSFKWFAGAVPIMTLEGDGDITVAGDMNAKKSLSVGGNYYYQYNTSDAVNPVYSIFSARDNLRVFWDMWNNGTNDISTSANGNMSMKKGVGTWEISSTSSISVGGTISSPMPVRMSMSLSTGLVTFNNGITCTGGTTTLGVTRTGDLTISSVTNPTSNTTIGTGAGSAGWNSFVLNNDVGTAVAYFGVGNSASPLPYRGNFYIQSAGNVVLNPGSVSGSRVFDLSSTGLTLSTGATFGGDVTVSGTNLNANQVRFPANASGLQWGPQSAPISRIYDDGQLHIWTDDNIYFDVGGAGAATGSITWSTNVLQLTSTTATMKVPLTVTSTLDNAVQISGGASVGKSLTAAELTVRGGTAEGGQINLGFRNNTTITGQSPNSWVMDVDAGNAFRIFNVNASNVTVSGVAIGTSGDITVQSTTASLSLTTGALQVSGGAGIQGSVYAGNMFIGPDAVATQIYVTGRGYITSSALTPYLTTTLAASTYQPTLTTTPGLTKSSGNVLSIDAAQPGITSVGTLTGLTSSGNVSITSTTASSSATSGALQIAGGAGIQGSLYAGNMFIGPDAVATQIYVTGRGYLTITTAAQTYQPILSTSPGLTKSANTLSIDAAQPGVTSLGTLTGLTSSGSVVLTSTTPSNSTGSGALQVAGGAGIAGNLYAANVYAGAGAYTGALLVSNAATTSAAPAFKVDLSGANLSVYRSGTADTVLYNSANGLLIANNNFRVNGTVSINGNNAATETWVNSAVSTALSPYATQTWVNTNLSTKQNTIGTGTSLNVGSLYINSNSVATENYVSSYVGSNYPGFAYASSLSSYATTTALTNGLGTKQDKIMYNTPIQMAGLTASSGNFQGGSLSAGTTTLGATTATSLLINGSPAVTTTTGDSRYHPKLSNVSALAVGDFSSGNTNVYGYLNVSGNITSQTGVISGATGSNALFVVHQSKIGNYGGEFALYSGADGYTVVNSYNSTAVQFKVNNVFKGEINSAGNLYVVGDVTAYSDARMKENIQPIPAAIDLVKRLQGVQFDWKRDGRRGIGLIAQAVQDVVPEVVHARQDDEDDDVTLSIAYGNLVAVLIEAVKELSGRVDQLEAQMTG
jgi:endosialidase-like protein